MITSVTLNGLEIGYGVYGVGYETLVMLEASTPRQALFVDLAGERPYFNRFQPVARVIPLNVMLHSITKAARRADFDALDAVTGVGEIPIRWTAEGVTREFMVVVENLTPDAWFTRAAATLTAANPVVAVV